ncbi:hypothetical protein J4476_05230 [Candidatus Woesearchaeota archaeon]|nr:hypothetical protein [Candidatus Woesearchaeota archaeon]HIH26031.1 hypothetical protein [Nanoarchaeota archaeon]
MFDLNTEKLNLEYRELQVNLKDIFPNLNFENIKKEFMKYKKDNPHEIVYNVAKELWNYGYISIMKENGFYEEEYKEFTGHCHQCTPIMGIVLKALGFEKVAYLEGYRIYESFLRNGIIEQVPPEDETDPGKVSEFVKIKRIPYCCLEVFIDGKAYYISPKHIKSKQGKTYALLTTSCYEDFTGFFAHQDDNKKSGIYIRPVEPLKNTQNIDFKKRVVWPKQTFSDPGAEYFATYLRMELKE